MAKILLVEDNFETQENVRRCLEFERHNVDVCGSGHEAQHFLRCFNYELIVLDWHLPELSGIEVCRQFRAQGGVTPILMLTGMQDITDKERGFNAGADDYLTKPFDLRELLLRVKALLKRPPLVPDGVIEAGPLRLDAVGYVLTMNGTPVDVAPKEFQLMEFLMRNPNKLFSAEELMLRVWPSDSDSSTEAARATIKRLRRKIDPDGKLLVTVHGVGFILRLR